MHITQRHGELQSVVGIFVILLNLKSQIICLNTILIGRPTYVTEMKILHPSIGLAIECNAM